MINQNKSEQKMKTVENVMVAFGVAVENVYSAKIKEVWWPRKKKTGL